MGLQEERIAKLEAILIKLHDGATPESVQADFDERFTGVSAIEIALMEQELVNGESGITFEDVLKLCNVHANMFKGAIDENDTPEADLPGHPVKVFKEENLSLRAALNRIHNIFNALEEMDSETDRAEILPGLKNQYNLIGQFTRHYDRKEKLFFPLLEAYGHEAPPKVMWAKDDEIRDLFKVAQTDLAKVNEIALEQVKASFEAFEYELKEMIFKEEAILINILLEALSREEWYQIAQESDTYGYTIISPTEKWEPADLMAKAEKETPAIEEPVQEVVAPAPVRVAPKQKRLSGQITSLISHSLTFDQGKLNLTWEGQEEDAQEILPLGHGALTREQIAMVLTYLPLGLAFLDLNGNLLLDQSEMANDLDRLAKAQGCLKKALAGEKVDEVSREGHTQLSYRSVYSKEGNLQGLLAIRENIQPFQTLPSEVKKDLSEIKEKQHSLYTLYQPVQSDFGQGLESYKISLPQGDLTVTWEAKKEPIFRSKDGDLTLNQVDAILNGLAIELTFIDKELHFRYFNDDVPYTDMLFKRTPSQIGRNVEFCHPPRSWPKVRSLLKSLEDQSRLSEQMWFRKGPEGPYVYVNYIGTYDEEGQFMGVLELVRDIRELI